MTTFPTAVSPHINEPTQLLVEQVAGMIAERPDWREHEPLTTAFKAFDAVCRVEPAVVSFVRQAVSDPTGGLTLDQIRLLMLSTIMRSSSSYGTIPELVVAMNLASDYEAAAKINDNAIHEAGTSTLTSHPQLLFQSFAVLACAVRTALLSRGVSVEFRPLTQASHALVRQILAIRPSGVGAALGADGLRRHLAEQQVYSPPFTQEDVDTALQYAGLCDHRVAAYHSGVLAQVLGMADRYPADGTSPPPRDPTNRGWLARQAFEFCAREASSADVGGSISYVGAYGLLAKAYLGYVPPGQRAIATKWWWVHSDEGTGMELGWGTTAELGHARDARALVARVFDGLSATNAAEAVRTATVLSHLRLQHWDVVTDRLRELGAEPGAVRVPFCFADFHPAAEHANETSLELRYDSETKSVGIVIASDEFVVIDNLDGNAPSRLMKALGIDQNVLERLRHYDRSVRLRPGIQFVGEL